MALSLSSPCGCPYDEDEEIAVFESTAAEHGGQARPRLPEISVISPGLDTRASMMEPVRVDTRMLCTMWSFPCKHSVCISCLRKHLLSPFIKCLKPIFFLHWLAVVFLPFIASLNSLMVLLCQQQNIKDVFHLCLQKLAVKAAVVRQGSANEGNSERVKVFLRIRPLTETERLREEDRVRFWSWHYSRHRCVFVIGCF